MCFSLADGQIINVELMVSVSFLFQKTNQSISPFAFMKAVQEGKSIILLPGTIESFDQKIDQDKSLVLFLKDADVIRKIKRGHPYELDGVK